jgi:hypothetical protein
MTTTKLTAVLAITGAVLLGGVIAYEECIPHLKVPDTYFYIEADASENIREITVADFGCEMTGAEVVMSEPVYSSMIGETKGVITYKNKVGLEETQEIVVVVQDTQAPEILVPEPAVQVEEGSSEEDVMSAIEKAVRVKDRNLEGAEEIGEYLMSKTDYLTFALEKPEADKNRFIGLCIDISDVDVNAVGTYTGKVYTHDDCGNENVAEISVKVVAKDKKEK